MGDVLATYLLHSTVLLGVTLGLLQLPGLRSPALRDVALRLALVAGLVTTAVAPLHRPAVPLRTATVQTRDVTAVPLPAPVDTASAMGATSRPPAIPDAAPTRGHPDAVALLLLGSLAIALLRFGSAVVQVRRSVVGPVTDAGLLAAVQTLHPDARLVWSRLPMPCAVGRRTLLLPLDVQARLTPDGRRAVLAHECAHLRRRDPLWTAGLSLLTQVLWFQPLNWVALGVWRDAAEERCDTWAATQAPGRALAQALVTLAASSARLPTSLTSPAVQPTHLTRRVHALLAPQETPMTRVHLLALTALPLVLGSALPSLAVAAPTRDVIVLDPAHGEGDPGAGGLNGLVEADLTLLLARKVQARLERQGVTVLLTRDPVRPRSVMDKRQNLDARVALVPEDARALVSIHANISQNAADRGVTTFFASSGAGAAVLTRSRTLADAVQAAVVAATGAVNLGTTGESFYMLRRSPVPAVLVEVGYVSNPDEARALQDAAYQDRVADGIADALLAGR